MLRDAQCPEPRGTLEKLPKSFVECNLTYQRRACALARPRWRDWTISGPGALVACPEPHPPSIRSRVRQRECTKQRDQLAGETCRLWRGSTTNAVVQPNA